MTGKKYIIPAALAIGAVSMIGLQAFAQSAPSTTPQSQPQVQSTTQAADDHNKGADIETNDDKGSTTVSDTDKETNDGGIQAANQNDQQDPGQVDGETND